MKQKIALTLAASAASFLLVGLGAVASTVVQPLQLSTTGNQSASVVDPADHTISLAVQAPALAAKTVQISTKFVAASAVHAKRDDQTNVLRVAQVVNHKETTAKAPAKLMMGQTCDPQTTTSAKGSGQ